MGRFWAVVCAFAFAAVALAFVPAAFAYDHRGAGGYRGHGPAMTSRRFGTSWHGHDTPSNLGRRPSYARSGSSSGNAFRASPQRQPNSSVGYQRGVAQESPSRPAYRPVYPANPNMQTNHWGQSPGYRQQNQRNQFAPTAPGHNHPPGTSQAFRPEYENSGTHLGSWMREHQNLPIGQQERALRSEPGFNRLPPQTQQRLMDRFAQINRMPPAQRQRTLGRIEAMERLSPAMRQQVRSAVQGINTLPPDREHVVKEAFHDLRRYPPPERQEILASPQFQNQFSPRERGMLRDVLSVEPYEPSPPQ